MEACRPQPRLSEADHSLQLSKTSVLSLLQLPESVLQLLLVKAWQSGRHNTLKALRLVCKEARTLVDSNTEGLQLNKRGPCLRDPPVPLATRFPRLKRLTVNAAQGWAQHFGDLIHGEQWLGVTKLTMQKLSAVVCARAMRACPNVQQCVIHSGGFSFGMPEMVQCAASALPSLTQLTVSHALGDKELAALAGCRSLCTLDMCLGPCSSSGWQAFLGTGVHSLRLQVDFNTLPHDAMTSWASGMTALTDLSLDNMDPFAEDPLLYLPTSLQKLTLDAVLMRFASALPQLTSLTCTYNHMNEGHLARLATHCPCLSDLSVNVVSLNVDCHAHPLTALTRLMVTDTFMTWSDTRFATIFPQLLEFHAQRVCREDAPPVSLFEGCTSLVLLDVGSVDSAVRDMMVLLSTDFQSLSCLAQLRLNISSLEQVACLGSLPRLHSLTMVFCRDASLDVNGAHVAAIARAFQAGAPPPQLTMVSFDFFDFRGCHAWNSLVPFLGAMEHQHLTGVALTSLASATVSWLLRGAPLLAHFEWQHNGTPADGDHVGLSDCDLFALAAHPSMERISIRNACRRITASMLRHIRQSFAGRGLQLLVDPA